MSEVHRSCLAYQKSTETMRVRVPKMIMSLQSSDVKLCTIWPKNGFTTATA